MKWQNLKFSKIVNDVTGGQKKIQKKAYLSQGRIPVIDQGQQLFAGYTNDETALFSKNIPVVLFGDHTRIFKYIDFPFALGADGVKVLETHDSLLPKFLYYYCQSIELPSRGYSRHFKFLKNIKIPLPPISEQRRIVEILEQADRLRKLRANADTKAQRILPASFTKMFGDPATNPMGWNTVLFDEVVEIGTQLVDPNQPDFLELPHIGGEHIEKETGRILSPPLVKDSNLLSNKFWFSSDHILLSKIRPYLNKVAYPRFNGVCSADIYPLKPKNNIVTHWYLLSLLRTQAFLDYAKVHSDRLRIPKLNKAQLGAFEFPLPDPHLMIAFDERVKKIISVENFRFARQEKVGKLYQLILHRAFTGGLTVSWRKAHLKKLLQEMDRQSNCLETLK